jgi:hypothetical protein
MTGDKRRPAPQIARQGHGPGYWMYETSGALRPAIVAYLQHEPMTDEMIAAMRAYLRQWIMAPVWAGVALDTLQARVDGLTTTEAIRLWLADALKVGIDPL